MKETRTINYRGLHDFIIADNEIKKELSIQRKSEEKIEEVSEKEEFLTKKDYDRANCQTFGIKNPNEINKLKNEDRSNFVCLQESAKQYIKKLDGDF